MGVHVVPGATVLVQAFVTEARLDQVDKSLFQSRLRVDDGFGLREVEQDHRRRWFRLPEGSTLWRTILRRVVAEM